MSFPLRSSFTVILEIYRGQHKSNANVTLFYRNLANNKAIVVEVCCTDYLVDGRRHLSEILVDTGNRELDVVTDAELWAFT